MLGTMARKSSAPPPPEPNEEPKSDRHKNTVVSFRPPAEMRARLIELAESERRSVAQIIEFLIEEALRARDARQGPQS